MKKNIILLMLASLIGFSGCYDLDRAPFDQLSSSTFWKTETQCVQGLMGIYSTYKNYNMFGGLFQLDINSDIGSGYDNYEALQLGTCTSSTGFMNNKWQNAYETVQSANLAIRNIGESELDQSVKVQLIGEAKFLRALAYFHLMDYYGGLPLYDETTNLETDINNLMEPRSSIEETRAFIIKDLNDAIAANLPNQWSADNYGRATASSVYGLLGKVLLHNKQYSEAITAFEQVLDPKYGHELHADFNELFTPNGKGSKEMIFCIVNSSGVGTEYGMPFAFYAGTRNTYGSCWNNTVPSTNLGNMYEYKDGRPFSWDELFPGYTDNLEVRERVFRATVNDAGTEVLQMPEEADQIRAMYEQRDPRFAATVIAPYMTYKGWYSNAPKDMLYLFAQNQAGGIMNLNEANGFMRNNRGGWETYFWKKFVPEYDWDGAITNRAHTPVNYPVIRLADVYLMLAECHNETGDQAKAVEYINKVRARVDMALINSGPAYLAANTKEEVFERIFRERAFELANEGHRDSDLRRWKLSGQLLNEVEDYGITGKRLFTRKFNEGRDYLWAIPASEIEKNPDLIQNPGW